MRLHKTVIADKPPRAVFGCLCDVTTTTTGWDPGTVVTVNHHGDGGAGTTYLSTSTFLGRQTSKARPSTRPAAQASLRTARQTSADRHAQRTQPADRQEPKPRRKP